MMHRFVKIISLQSNSYSVPVLAKKTMKEDKKKAQKAQSFFTIFSVAFVLPPCSSWFYSKIDFERYII